MDESVYGWWLPPDVSTHGHQIDHLINVLHWFMLALFLGWGAFYAYCIIRFRASKGIKAVYEPIKASASKYLEIGVALFEVFLLVGLSMPVWAELRNPANAPSREEALQIRVTAEQFAWNIHYPGPDGVFGKTDIKMMSRSNPLGADFDDPAGKDDVRTVNQFHMPVGKPVFVELSSKDVIHSFFIPVLRVKQDAVPGQKIPMWFEADETGEFELACAQLCGIAHTRMGGRVYIETQEQFDAWIAEKVREAQEE
ncbi:MAG: cytochrome c oxidase subunit II [Bdellovibrionota bacterium]